MKTALRLSSVVTPEKVSGLSGEDRLDRLVLPVVLLLVFAIAARTPLDTDTWWHLRAGEQTWTAKQILLSDPFSYTRYGQPWTNHSWLAQVGMYLVFHLGGPVALSGVMGLAAAASMGLVYLQMRGSPLLKGFVLIFAAVVASMVWTPRPQLLSLLMFGLTAYLLYLFKWKRKGTLAWLPPIFILWSNLHGGYVLGFLLITGMLAGELLNHLLGYEGEEIVPWRSIGRLASWGGLCLLAVLINPNGIHTWLIPFQTVGVQALQAYISEWASPDFHAITQQPMLWLLLGTFAAVGFSRNRLDGTDFVWFAGFALMAFVARRNFGPFAMAAAPVLVRHLDAGLSAWKERTAPAWRNWVESHRLEKYFRNSGRQASPKFALVVNMLLITAITVAVGIKWIAVSNPAFFTQKESELYPAAAVEWIQANRPEGRMFNGYNWGGYLIWRLREAPVFIDGRTDLYGDEIIGQWLQAVNAKDDWQTVLDDWQVGYVFIERYQPLAGALQKAGWRLAYSDQQAVIYTRPDQP